MNYFDCHADTLTEIISGETLDQNSGDLDLNRLGDFVENYTQIFAVWKDAQNLNMRILTGTFCSCITVQLHILRKKTGKSCCAKAVRT